LVPQLLLRGYEVIVVDNLMYGQTSLLGCCYNENFTFIEADVREEHHFMYSLYKDADVIIPLAAIVGAPACNKRGMTDMTYQTNYTPIASMCHSLSHEQLVLFPSTTSGYGRGEDYCTEESTPLPLSSYAIGKLDAENVLLERENTIVFRFATAFGVSPRMRIDLLVNDFVYQAYNEKKIMLFEGGFRRDFIHVIDIARILANGITMWYGGVKQNIFNAGGGINITKRQLCEQIKKYISDLYVHEAEVHQDPDKRDYFISSEKLNNILGPCVYSLDEGIIELIKAYSMFGRRRFSNV